MSRTDIGGLLAGWSVCTMLALLVAVGCGDGSQGAAQGDAGVDFRAKYEALLEKNENEVYPKLARIDELQSRNGELVEENAELAGKLEEAREELNQNRSGRLKEELAAKDEQIKRLLAQVDELKTQSGRTGETAGDSAADARAGLALAQVEMKKLARELVDLRMYAQALAALTAAVDLGCVDPEVFFLLAYVHGENSQAGGGDAAAGKDSNELAAKWYARAVAALAEAEKPDARLAAKVYNNYGATLVALERPGEALGWYEKSIEADPQYATVHFNLGRFYDQHQKASDEAIAAYRRHIALGGDRGIAARDAILRLQEETAPDE